MKACLPDDSVGNQQLRPSIGNRRNGGICEVAHSRSPARLPGREPILRSIGNSCSPADEDDRPDSYQLLKIEVADDVASESVSLSSLPPDWKGDEAVTRAIGDDWLERGATALLRVPSVITPETYHWLLNPRHADARRAAIVHIDRPLYDSRLFRG
jgi:hypothetical protein